MLTKKFYIPIGLCVLALLAIGFLLLRSGTSKEPIKVYKTITPTKVAKTEAAETAIGGHFHADGTFHADPHQTEVSDTRLPDILKGVPKPLSEDQPRGILLPTGEMITDPDKIAEHLEKEKRLMEDALSMLEKDDAYIAEYGRYTEALKAYYKESERLYSVYESGQSEFESLVFDYDTEKLINYIDTLSYEKQLDFIDELKAAHALTEKAAEAYRAHRSQKPIAPIR